MSDEKTTEITETKPEAPAETPAAETTEAPAETPPDETKAEAKDGDDELPAITRDSLETPPEKLTKEALVALVRALNLAGEIDLRRTAKAIRTDLFKLRPDLAPGFSDELSKLEDEAAELEEDAAAGDPLAAAELPTVRARVESEAAAKEAYDRTVAAAFPAVPWLREHGFDADPRHMSTRALLEALLALASSGKPLPDDLVDVLDPWLGLALERLTDEERQIIATAHDAATRDARKKAKGEVVEVVDDGVRFALVERFAKFCANSFVYELQAGIVITSTEYDFAELGRQGVPLRSLTAAEAKRLRGA